MKVITWDKEDGCTIAVLFENGTSAAESVRVFKDKKEVKAAKDWLQKHCGKEYSNNNFPWTVTNPKTGETRRLFLHRNLASM